MVKEVIHEVNTTPKWEDLMPLYFEILGKKPENKNQQGLLDLVKEECMRAARTMDLSVETDRQSLNRSLADRFATWEEQNDTRLKRPWVKASDLNDGEYQVIDLSGRKPLIPIRPEGREMTPALLLDYLKSTSK